MTRMRLRPAGPGADEDKACADVLELTPGVLASIRLVHSRLPCSNLSVFPSISFPHLHLHPSVCPSHLSLSLSLPVLPLCSVREGQKWGAALPGERLGDAGVAAGGWELWAGDQGPCPTGRVRGKGVPRGLSPGLLLTLARGRLGWGCPQLGSGTEAGLCPEIQGHQEPACPLTCSPAL